MKRTAVVFLLAWIGLLTFLSGCIGPAEIPTQNETPETVVEAGTESSPSGAAVAGVNETVPFPAEEGEAVAAEVVEESAGAESSPVAEEIKPPSTYVILEGVGFGVDQVRIKVGETVVWKNEREGRQQKALVLGTQWCSATVKSGFFNPGEVYRATFNKAGTCTIVDGMYTTEIMKVIVEE